VNRPSRARVSLAAWAGLAACLGAAACAGASKRARAARAFDPEGRAIRAVAIEGNRAFSDESIESRLALREPQGWGGETTAYNELAFEIDQKRIVAFYRERGYFDAELVGAERFEMSFGQVGVRFRVREGEPTRITSICVVVTPSTECSKDRDLVEAAGLEPGDRFEHGRYTEAKTRLRKLLVERGHAHAQTGGQVAVERDARTAEIRLDVDAGPLVEFGELRITEKVPVPDDAVRARVSWKPGDRFDPEEIDLTKKRLRALGLFGSVHIEYERQGRPPVARVTIDGRRALHEFRLGVGAALDSSSETTQLETRVRSGVSIKQLPFALSTSRVDGVVAWTTFPGEDLERELSYELAFALEQADLLIPRSQWTFRAAPYDKKVFEAYTTFGPRALVGVSVPMLDDQIAIGVQMWSAYLDVDADDAQLQLGLDTEDPLVLAVAEQSFTFDRRDRPLDAHRGGWVQLALEEGAAPTYLKWTAEGRLYVEIVDRLVGAVRAKAGHMFGVGGGDPPITQRYYGGGAASHRGFGLRRLSPRVISQDGDAVPVGGDALVEVSAEARLDLLRGWWDPWVGVTAFVDGGDVTETLDELDLADLHWAIGLGARHDTPIGPFRFDVAYRVNRTGAGEPDGGLDDPWERFAFHISFGEAF
jgi:translocation and assembly module TamA